MVRFRVSASVIAFAALLASGLCSADPAKPLIIDSVYVHPARLVRVEPGRKMNLYCIGSGSPTVVFDAGLTDETSAWGLVQPAVALKTRACSYDRAGVGFSDPGKRPGSSVNIVDDLHRLLVRAHVRPPYVLVGHSYGGMNIKLYAAIYPSEVVGMVFVDPSHEDQTEGYRTVDPRHLSPEEWRKQIIEPSLIQRRECVAAAPSGFTPGTELYKKCSFPQDPRFSQAINDIHQKLYMRPGFQLTQLGEEESVFSASADQVRAARRSFDDMPLIVLARPPSTSPLRPTETQELRDSRYSLLMHLNNDIASLSTKGVNRVVPNSGHNIPYDQPNAVADAIIEVLSLSEIRLKTKGR